MHCISGMWRVWRYQRGNQNVYIEEEPTTKWPKGNKQKDKQRSTKHTYKTKNRVTRTPLKIDGTRRVNLVTNPVISREWWQNWEVLTTGGTYSWSFVTQIFNNGQPSHGGARKIFEVMTSTLPRWNFGTVASLLAATLYQGYLNRNHKLWNIESTERYILHMQVLLECFYL